MLLRFRGRPASGCGAELGFARAAARLRGSSTLAFVFELARCSRRARAGRWVEGHAPGSTPCVVEVGGDGASGVFVVLGDLEVDVQPGGRFGALGAGLGFEGGFDREAVTADDRAVWSGRGT